MLELPLCFQDLYVACFDSSHEEQHMNENIKRKKQQQKNWHMGTLQDISYALFNALSLLPTLDV